MAQPASRDFGAEVDGFVPEVVDPIQPPTSEQQPRPKVKFQDVFRNEETREDPPEQFLMNTMAMRPRAMSHHLQSSQVPSRKLLLVKARFWRSLMTFAMNFHSWARPTAPKPSFVRRISTDTIPIDLYFYVPKDYEKKKKHQPDYRYPIVVNFHGGGFCLGHATDDRYWARVILKDTPAVFVSVNYRRAPEHPFPQPVDDCVEALLYLQVHAEELHVDPSQVALSGFSAGANLAFTVPFRLTYQYEKQSSTEHLPLDPPKRTQSNWVPEPESPETAGDSSPNRTEQETGLLTPRHDANNTPTINNSPWSSAADLRQTSTKRSDWTPQSSKTNLLNVPGPRSYLLRNMTEQSRIPRHDIRSDASSRSSSPEPAPQLRIVSILAWYPLLDWTSSRSEKKRSSRMPKKTLPAVFTDLFDFSYLPAPDTEGHHCSPYASPSLAPDHMIVDGLPQRIQMWLCEWDMLLAEGERFSERLSGLGKDVKTELITGVPHGWDKSPNPFRDQKRTNELYERAAGYLRSVFGAADRRATVGEGIGLGGLR
ncbi:hypothetical protein LTR70_007913 [Exophiala xenobiotica]|uniref:Alpha/beta hydrolase fold-3 domain-containing protein n=1 Tax=Lithohypha guttulata TaxID=1690604 RepID=A0ABR0K8Q7_9EURO|nr:hypothetical protein LTR24_005589 [Lithohypha guttulata]KAK5312918.1 hypothetical protein LTR70_007913 [Exophiala xenobiotica]